MYYILPKAIFMQHVRHLAGAQYIDLPDGVNVLAKAKFTLEAEANRFEAHPNVQSLPHPSTSKQIGPGVAKQLAHMGVTESHTTYDVASLAAKIHPMMRFRG